MKVSELKGVDLDYWSAIASRQKVFVYRSAEGVAHSVHTRGSYPTEQWNPSANWTQAGKIIDTHGIYFEPSNSPDIGEIFAYINDGNLMPGQWGASHIEAALRCFIANKIGDEVTEANQ